MCSLISNLNLSVERVICHSPVGFYWQGLSYYSFAHKGIHINTPIQAPRSWTPATSCSLVTPQGREHVNAKAVSNGYRNRQRLRGRRRFLPLLSLERWLLEVQPWFRVGLWVCVCAMCNWNSVGGRKCAHDWSQKAQRKLNFKLERPAF